MAAALRRILLQRRGSIPVASPAMLLLVRCLSTAPAPAHPPSAASEEYCTSSVSIPPAASSSEEYCYALGAFGKMQFSKKHFVPIEQYMKDNEDSILEPIPVDRLIGPPKPDEEYNFYTSHNGKQFIRSGYLAAYFAKRLNLSISSAFAEGNVGVLSGIDTVAFLKLDESNEMCAADGYPLTYRGFSSFLEKKMTEIYSSKAKLKSLGLQELFRLSHHDCDSDRRIIYHPEFLSLDALASVYVEAHRILRRQMPSTGEDNKAWNIVVRLDTLLGEDYSSTCASDPLLSGWLGLQVSESSFAGAFGLSLPSGAKLDLSLLRSADRKKLKKLTRLAYGMSETTTPKSVPTPHYPRDPNVPVNFPETRVVDVHRHCMVHLVQEDTIANFFQVLPQSNVVCLKSQKPTWKDGVYLLLSRFGVYPHHLVGVFDEFDIWEALDLELRCPIPQIYFSPPFSHISIEKVAEKDDAALTTVIQA